MGPTKSIGKGGSRVVRRIARRPQAIKKDRSAGAASGLDAHKSASRGLFRGKERPRCPTGDAHSSGAAQPFFFAAAFLAGAFFAAGFFAGAFFAAALAILILPLSESCRPNQLGLEKYAHIPEKC